MMKKNKGKRALTAVGAVVAAGLTPGFIAASAAGSSIQSSSTATTAAEVVAIDGQAYSFDELYAMQNRDSLIPENLDSLIHVKLSGVADVARYGAPSPSPSPRIMHEAARRMVDIAYRQVDQMPTFPGGEAALMEYIESHIQYPANALKNHAQGRVIVEFIVTETGEIGLTKVFSSMDKDLDKEAVRVCKSLPKFTPGRMNGKVVPVWYRLPVKFTLPKENKD